MAKAKKTSGATSQSQVAIAAALNDVLTKLNSTINANVDATGKAETAQTAMNKAYERQNRTNRELLSGDEQILNVRNKMDAMAKKLGISEIALAKARAKEAGETIKASSVMKTFMLHIRGQIEAFRILYSSMTRTQKEIVILKLAFKGMAKVLKVGFKVLAAAGKVLGKVLSAVFSGISSVFKSVFNGIIAIIFGILNTAFNVLVDSVKTIGVAFETLGKLAWIAISESIKGAFEVVSYAIKGVYGIVKNTVGQLIDIFLGQFPIIPDVLKEFGKLTETVFVEVNALIVETFTSMVNTVGSLLKDLLGIFWGPFEAIQNMLKTIGDFVGNVLTNIIKAATNIIKASLDVVFNITQMIISSTLKLMMTFWNTATQMMSGISQWRQEMEKLRAEYGNLERSVGKFAITMAKSSLGAFRQFHYLRGEVLALSAELMKNLGPTAEALIGQFSDPKNQVMLMLFNKGLKLSAEALQEIGKESLASGEPMVDILREIHDASQGLAKAFGVSAKLISSDIGNMKVDVANWGALTTKQMAVASMRIRSLGLEIKDVAGIIKSFDTFADAAKNVSMLTRAFGIQLDSLKMMREEDPTKRIEMIRKEFERTGQSTEKMSRRQIMLLAQTSGLSEATARAAFSTKNQGKSIEEINKQLDKSGKKKKTDKDRVIELREEIERLIKSGQTFGGIWEAITKGFDRGIYSWARQTGVTREVTLAMRNIYRITRNVTFEFLKFGKTGKAVGAEIRKFFGIFTKYKLELTNIFRTFLHDIEERVPNAVEKAWTGVTGIFEEGGFDIKRTLKDLSKLFIAIFDVIAGTVIKIIGEMMIGVLDWINNPQGNSGINLKFQYIVEAFKNVWPRISDGFSKLWESISKSAVDWWDKMWDDGKKEGAEKGTFARWKDGLIEWATETGNEIYTKLWGWMFGDSIAVNDWDNALIDLKAKFKKFVDDVGEFFKEMFVNIGNFFSSSIGAPLLDEIIILLAEFTRKSVIIPNFVDEETYNESKRKKLLRKRENEPNKALGINISPELVENKIRTQAMLEAAKESVTKELFMFKRIKLDEEERSHKLMDVREKNKINAEKVAAENAEKARLNKIYEIELLQEEAKKAESALNLKKEMLLEVRRVAAEKAQAEFKAEENKKLELEKAMEERRIKARFENNEANREDMFNNRGNRQQNYVPSRVPSVFSKREFIEALPDPKKANDAAKAMTKGADPGSFYTHDTHLEKMFENFANGINSMSVSIPVMPQVDLVEKHSNALAKLHEIADYARESLNKEKYQVTFGGDVNFVIDDATAFKVTIKKAIQADA